MSFWFIIYYILRLPHVFYPARKKKKKDASQFFLPLLAEHIFFTFLYGSFFKLTFLLHVLMNNFCSFFPSPPTL